MQSRHFCWVLWQNLWLNYFKPDFFLFFFFLFSLKATYKVQKVEAAFEAMNCLAPSPEQYIWVGVWNAYFRNSWSQLIQDKQIGSPGPSQVQGIRITKS
jgi:hypothetical protein